MALPSLGEFPFVVLIALLGALAALLEVPGLIRVPLALPLLFFLPGYAVMSILFPARGGLDGLERGALGFGLSLATLPLVILGLEYSPWQLELTPIVLGLVAVTVLASALAVARRAVLPPEQRYAPSLPQLAIPNPGAWDRPTLGIVLAAIVGLMLFGGASAAIIAARTQEEPLTEFAVLSPNGEAAYYPRELVAGEPAEFLLEIGNHEGATTSYRIEMRIGEQQLDTLDVTVEDGEVHREPVSVSAPGSTPGAALTFALYRTDPEVDDEPYRELRLQVEGVLPTATATPEPTATATEPAVEPPTAPPPASEEPLQVTGTLVGIVNSDELLVNVDGEELTVQLLGVEAPDGTACFAPEALAHTTDLLARAGGAVILERDPATAAEAGGTPLRRYVWLSHPDGMRLLNEEIVKWGYGYVATDGPNHLYVGLFAAQQASAAQQGLGLWSACPSSPPAELQP